MSTKVKGYAVGILAAATYGMNPLFALPLYKEGMDSNSVLLFRYLIAIPIIAIMIKARGRSLAISRSEILPLTALGVLLGISSISLFESYNYMEASIASTLLFIYPLMVALIMAFMYHERITLQTTLCLVAALGGIAMLYKGGSDGATLSLLGTILVVISSLSYAIYIVGVNRPKMSKVPTLKLTFYALVAGSMVFISKALYTGHVALPHTPVMWLEVLALAVLPTVVSFACTTLAIQYIGSTPTAILGVFEPVTAIFFGVVIFGEVLTRNDIIGIILIMTAVSLVVAGDKLTPKRLVAIKKLFPRLPRFRKHG